MNFEELNIKLLDSLIKTMGRNRNLLFVINLLAGIILATIYLGEFNFDDQQRREDLLSYKYACQVLNDKVFESHFLFTELEIMQISECYDLPKITSILSSRQKINDEKLLSDLSRHMYSLYRSQNEMKTSN